MTELSDYKRMVEQPMIRSYEIRIQKLRTALLRIDRPERDGESRRIAQQAIAQDNK